MDEKIYEQYLKGDKKAFERLYKKYQNKILYFILNIVKDYQKAEELTQDVFLYLLNNKFDKDVSSFKGYIYLVAKSKAFTYMKKERRREEIKEKTIEYNQINYENDLLEQIIEKESKNEILEAIRIMNSKYRDTIYLAKIEGLSYKEISTILDISIQDVKNYVHRGGKELKNILIKNGYRKSEKMFKNIIVLLFVTMIISGVAYAVTKMYINNQNNQQFFPSFTNSIGENDINRIWVGTFQLVWNEYSNNIIRDKIQFVEGESQLADELNKQIFNKNMISDKDYYVKVGITSEKLKEEIMNDIKKKFKIENFSALNQINFRNDGNLESYTLYAVLYKNFNFIHPFNQLYSESFNNSDERIKYFGINNASSETLNDNVEVLFYNDNSDYAVSLKTMENEELILYCNNENESFDSLYHQLLEKENVYLGEKKLLKFDEIKIPYIIVDTIINYGELCGREIKNTNGKYIQNAIQNIRFELNESGGNLISEAILKDAYFSANLESRYFYFDKPFVLFLKESDKLNPYFALKIDNTELLVEE